MQIGRRVLTTDVAEVTLDNVIQILQDVEPEFIANSYDCERLLSFEAGNQPLGREKKVRPDIDVQTVDNVAHEIAEFKEGYHWGNLITFVQRGTKDSGGSEEADAIALLNECYAAENAGGKQSDLAYYVEICGIGYTFIDIRSDFEDGDSYFQYEVLDPRFAFVVRSNRYSDKRVMLGVTMRVDNMGNRYFTAFSKDRRFEISAQRVTNGDKVTTVWGQEQRSGERNPLGMIPIVEYVRSTDRMGVFEREIPEMMRLNLILSDIGNDIDQETQQIWHANDVDFPRVMDADGNPTDEIKRPKSNDWVITETTKDGRSPFIKPLGSAYDYGGITNTYLNSRALILQRCFTPCRNDDSGGSTGVAMSDATGWSAAEQVACKQQLLTEASKMQEVKVVLRAIKKNANLPSDSPLIKLRYMDVKPNITRQKTYELSVKSTALGVLISHGVNGLHALKTVNLFEDVAQTWSDSKATIEEYQRNSFGDKEEIKPQSDDPINQIENSPLIDGMAVEAEQK
jgi:hypothetical protein